MQPCTGNKCTIFFCKMVNVFCTHKLQCHTICRACDIHGNSIDRVWHFMPALWHYSEINGVYRIRQGWLTVDVMPISPYVSQDNVKGETSNLS